MNHISSNGSYHNMSTPFMCPSYPCWLVSVSSVKCSLSIVTSSFPKILLLQSFMTEAKLLFYYLLLVFLQSCHMQLNVILHTFVGVFVCLFVFLTQPIPLHMIRHFILLLLSYHILPHFITFCMIYFWANRNFMPDITTEICNYFLSIIESK